MDAGTDTDAAIVAGVAVALPAPAMVLATATSLQLSPILEIAGITLGIAAWFDASVGADTATTASTVGGVAVASGEAAIIVGAGTAAKTATTDAVVMAVARRLGLGTDAATAIVLGVAVALTELEVSSSRMMTL